MGSSTSAKTRRVLRQGGQGELLVEIEGIDLDSAGWVSILTARNGSGRQHRVDSYGQTWYSYDAHGHVTAELRLRAGLSTCTNQLTQDVAATNYTWSPNGYLTSIVYPFGRTVTYNYGIGGLADRVASVTTTETDGASWLPTAVPLVSGVVWEPYGGIRAYVIDNQTACAPTYVNYRHVKVGTGADPHTGQLGSLTVGTTDGSDGPPHGYEIYHRDYTWTADQVTEIDTYLLGSATPRVEQYNYDQLLRLTDAVGSNFDAVGGSFAAHHYTYDGRGNRIAETGTGSSTSGANNCDPTLTYSSSHVDQLTGVGCSASGSLNSATYSYDSDGRVQEIQGPNYSGTPTPTPAWQMILNSGPDGTTPNSGAEDSVYKNISVGGVTYGYFYDAFNRRRLKSYPADGVSDEFYYRVDNMLMSDIGNDDVMTPTFHPIDEYVWLGGRPIAVVRSRLKLVSNGSGSYDYVHDQDGTGSCMRNDDPQSCGIFDIITDHIGAPVLMLDGNQLVVGEGSMDPFGAVNTVALTAETAHPYAANTNQTLATLAQPAWGAGTTTRLRARFNVVDTDTAAGDAISFVDPDNADAVLSSTTPIGGTREGQEMSAWLTPTAGRVAVRFTSSTTSGGTQTGAVLAGYDYQRYQTGTSPTWMPLRYPGQYWDDETSLTQNQNRFVEANSGRFLASEPLLSEPLLFMAMATNGRVLSAYTYALGNPVFVQDRDGLWPIIPLGLPPIVPGSGWKIASGAMQNAAAGWQDAADFQATATAAAKATGLPGQVDGLQDAFRHCYWSCVETARGHGTIAHLAGVAHEFPALGADDQMDLANNECGRKYGSASASGGGPPTEGDCASRCLDGATNGDLTHLNPSFVPGNSSYAPVPMPGAK